MDANEGGDEDKLGEGHGEESNREGGEGSDVLLGDIRKVNNGYYILAGGVDSSLMTLPRVQGGVPLMTPALAYFCKVGDVKSVANQRMPCC